MAPPLFAELGKPCSHLLNNGFPLGQVKLDVGVRTCGNVNINTTGAIRTEDWSLDGAIIDSKFTVQPPRWKTTFNESWDLNNKIKFGVITDDLAGYLPGVKLSTGVCLDPKSGKFSGKLVPQVKTEYATMEFGGEAGDESTSALTGSFVGGYRNWVAGVKGQYNVSDGRVDHTVGVGYLTPSIQANLFCDNMENCRCSVYQKINDNVEAGVMIGFNPGSSSVNASAVPVSDSGEESEIVKPSGGGSTKDIAIGGRFILNPTTSLKAKINNSAKLGMSLEKTLREGAILTLAMPPPKLTGEA